MRQAVMTGPGRIQVRHVDPPEPGPGQVLVRVKRIGVSGADLHVFRGKHPAASYPLVQGHEFSAVIEAVGASVEDLRVGQKVTALPQVVCGQCHPCRRGLGHLCDHVRVRGFQTPGLAQELAVLPVHDVVALPEEFTFEQGVMVEPLAMAVHAVGRAGACGNANVAVLGAGTVGNLVAQTAQADGARVMVSDLNDHRLELARQCGINRTFNAGWESLGAASQRHFGHEGFSIACDCAGVEATLGAAIANINKGGVVVLAGGFGDWPRLNAALVQQRELSLRGTAMYALDDIRRAVALLGAGKVRVDPLLGRHFALEDFEQAYRYIAENPPEASKVIIDVEG